MPISEAQDALGIKEDRPSREGNQKELKWSEKARFDGLSAVWGEANQADDSLISEPYGNLRRHHQPCHRLESIL
ncbi:hypothetical protein NA645_20065 [Pseudomonas stutzeri]|uniref:hypothetical protein n=1 Tax=Stutzerimonas stutzeri TaxID=316 RepID=UPI002108A5A8|nr:hypothetical protein [Stutzerimonas stutzeri]MCQ4310282.1 hypothetical protein [Stutzerimonas stutzeri]